MENSNERVNNHSDTAGANSTGAGTVGGPKSTSDNGTVETKLNGLKLPSKEEASEIDRLEPLTDVMIPTSRYSIILTTPFFIPHSALLGIFEKVKTNAF